MNRDINTKHNSQCLQKAWEDEPIFVILGRDPCGPSAVMAWMMESVYSQPHEKIEDALEVVKQMRAFFDANAHTFQMRKQSGCSMPVASAPTQETLMEAIATLCNALKHDTGLWEGWKANIAVAFQEQWIRLSGSLDAEVYRVSNEAANAFLELLTERNAHDNIKTKQALNASEAIYGFMAWLTTRKHTLFLGSAHSAAPVVPLVVDFIQANGLPACREGWQNNLIPVTKESTATEEQKEERIIFDDSVFDAFDKWVSGKYEFFGGLWYMASMGEPGQGEGISTSYLMKLFGKNAIG